MLRSASYEPTSTMKDVEITSVVSNSNFFRDVPWRISECLKSIRLALFPYEESMMRCLVTHFSYFFSQTATQWMTLSFTGWTTARLWWELKTCRSRSSPSPTTTLSTRLKNCSQVEIVFVFIGARFYDLTYREVKSIIKTSLNNKWKESHPEYNKQDGVYCLNRRGQTTVFRLRTGHNWLKYHIHKIFKDLCSCGQAAETVQHVLQDCRLYSNVRQSIWRERVDMHTKLYGPLPELEKTVAFIAQAGIGIWRERRRTRRRRRWEQSKIIRCNSWRQIIIRPV